MKLKYGCTRIVFVFENFVLKVPNYKYSHYHFLQGCQSNYSERNYCKEFKNANYEGNMYEFVAPSFYCSLFGLLLIQARCTPIETELSFKQKEFYKPLCGTDNKKENFGMYKNKMVCLDYP